MAAWQDKGTLIAGGKRLEYACFGPPPTDAPTLVLLHEGLGCLALWRDLPSALAAATGYGVLVYSRAGYGQSDPADLPRPLDYMTREAVNVLPQILDTISIEKAVLLGHSDGATIAAILAGSVQDHRIRGLILMAPHFFTESMALTEIARARSAFDSGDLRTRLAKYHRDPDNAFRGWNNAWLHPDFRDWNVSDVLEHICVPILAIQGRQDQYGTLVQIEEITSRCYAPVETLILDACRHSPFADQPDVVLAAITEYCTRLSRIEGAAPQ